MKRLIKFCKKFFLANIVEYQRHNKSSTLTEQVICQLINTGDKIVCWNKAQIVELTRI